MKTIRVVAAIIVNDTEILCAQRGSSKLSYIHHKYEFPGGKIESDETKEAAIIREIDEELKLAIEAPQFFMTVEHSYPDFNIIMDSFICNITHRNVVLTEHLATQWLPISELHTLDWAAADIPIVEKLQADKL